MSAVSSGLDEARMVNRENPIDPGDEALVNDAIAAWCASGTRLTLHDYLGWTREQVLAWSDAPAEDPSDDADFLPDAARWVPHERTRLESALEAVCHRFGVFAGSDHDAFISALALAAEQR